MLRGKNTMPLGSLWKLDIAENRSDSSSVGSVTLLRQTVWQARLRGLVFARSFLRPSPIYRGLRVVFRVRRRLL